MYDVNEKTDLIREHSRNLARNIESFRKAKRLTQVEFAQVSDLPQTVISNLESGWANPSLLTLVRLGKFMQASVGEILSREND
jgi:DNA-binding XRE family transcriptional regulator